MGTKRANFVSRKHLFISAAFLAAEFFSIHFARATYGVFITPVATNAYGATDTNSCAIDVNNLITDGNYQFMAYYNTSDQIMIARRSLGSNNWTSLYSGYTVTSSDIADDHDVISMDVDANGDMHMVWGMHNVPLNYAISAPVTGSNFSLSFTTQTSTNDPSLFPSSGSTTNEVTYGQFYTIPNSADLLFAYRNGGSGGGSGNGNEYFDLYNPRSRTFSQTYAIDGELTSVNAYLNSMAYTTTGNLLASWTWRATPNWQTNQNIMFAQSPTNGSTWFEQGGSTQYDLPIIQTTTSADRDTKSVAQVIDSIPQGDSFINQTSMTVDLNNNPLIATYYSPGWTATSATAGSGNPNRQYMLVYYDGSTWRTSQVSNRTSDTAVDYSGNDVRDLGRPIVMVDKQGRVIVVTRSENTSMGSNTNPATPNNDIVVYWNTTASLDSASPSPWQSITLDTANMGQYEPTYDSTLWQEDNILDLFYEPVGLTGETQATVQVLQWNEQYYFNPILGDADGNGTVDATDLAILQKYLGQSVTGGYANGDFNDDGIVNVDDFALYQEGLAKYNASLVSVPEPALLAIFLALPLTLRRKR
jgi:hypothetical protein